MRTTGSVLISVLMILLVAPLVHGQDLSKYRGFSFGMSRAEVAQQVAPQTLQTKMVFRHPAIVEEVTWWPRDSSGGLQRVEPVWQVLFTFYNGELSRILVTYDSQATKGLTVEDMVDAISGQYGPATRPNVPLSFPTNELYMSSEIVTARWEDSQYSFNLFRSSFLNSFGLVMFSKRLDARVRVAFAESLKHEKQAEDPREESARLRTEADKLEVARQRNRKIFRP